MKAKCCQEEYTIYCNRNDGRGCSETAAWTAHLKYEKYLNDHENIFHENY
jgi:hypothetical protein